MKESVVQKDVQVWKQEWRQGFGVFTVKSHRELRTIQQYCCTCGKVYGFDLEQWGPVTEPFYCSCNLLVSVD